MRLPLRLLYTLAAGLLATAAPAQTPPPAPTPAPALAPADVPAPPADPRWRKSLKAGLGLNESLLSTNWRGGGVNTVGFNALVNAQANRRRGIHSFDNEADFLFAFSQTKGLGYRKGQDRLYLDTKYGRALSPRWDLFASLNLLTQFAPGYQYDEDAGQARVRAVSDFFAPGFLTAAYGFEYHPAPSFHLRLAPFAPRLTVVGRPERYVAALGEAPYGVRPGRRARWEVLALQVLAEFDKNLSPSTNLKARYVLFASYENLRFREIDHRLDLGLTAKVGRYVNVSLNAIALYDFNQDNEIQFSQGLTLGVAYAFQNFADEKK